MQHRLVTVASALRVNLPLELLPLPGSHRPPPLTPSAAREEGSGVARKNDGEAMGEKRLWIGKYREAGERKVEWAEFDQAWEGGSRSALAGARGTAFLIMC